MAWSLTTKAWEVIRHLVPDGKTVLELGSGVTTSRLVKHYTVYSVENDTQWVGKHGSKYIHAPIVKYSGDYLAPDIPGLKKLNQERQVGWYNPKVIQKALEGVNYDFILIDGPKARIGRGGFLLHLDIFDTSVPMLFDDVVSESEFILLQKVSEELNVPYFLLSDEDEDGKECRFGLINVQEEDLVGFDYEGPIHTS